MFRKKRKKEAILWAKTEYGTAEGSLPRNRPMLVLVGRAAENNSIALSHFQIIERGLAKPQEILALTFSKAAAEEMKSRFENLNGASGVSFGTFHSIFFRISAEQIRLECGADFSGGGKEEASSEIVLKQKNGYSRFRRIYFAILFTAFSDEQ